MKESSITPVILPMTSRQKIRRTLTLVAFLLFPVTFKFYSPYVIVDGAAQGIIVGSFIYFISLFIISLFLGRAVCGWACPAASLQEWSCTINNKPVKGGKVNWIKYGIWIPWIGIISAAVISAGGFKTIDSLYMIENGVSLSRIYPLTVNFTSSTAQRGTICNTRKKITKNAFWKFILKKACTIHLHPSMKMNCFITM